ncbi:MBG domain-containing protein, partial [Candidatus Collinsella stercoripullorum]|uniref:MBG domain-containing protein n=1 Tax=Candidatus Collinsella stercoripullorum TaxID=2838522 RepID=UPI0022DF283F
NEITFRYVANTDTKYTVEHWFQNVDGDGYTQSDEYPNETLEGTTDTMTAAVAKQVEGFTAQDIVQQTIAGDGSTVVKVYYNRNTYTVTYEITGSFFANPTYEVVENVRYGAELSLITDDMSQDGYTWSGWSKLPETMPASDVTVTGSYRKNIDGSQLDVSTPTDVIYDGHSHQWAPTVLDKENGDALTYGEDYSVAYTDEAGNEVTDFTNVTGKIIVTITGEGNYTGSVTREYQITPRPVDLVIPTQTKTYDGAADVLGSEPIILGFEPAAQMDEGFVAGDDLTVTIAPKNVKFSQADVHTDGALIADIANVVADGEDAGNYMLRNISGIGSISEHGVEGFTLTASGYAGAYDGQEHAAVSSISVTGQYQPDTEWDLTFALSKDGEYSSELPVVTNVSDSTTVWVKASNANYGEMTVSVEAQVTPLTLTVTANNQTKVAGTADPALTSTYTGALPGETPGWTGTIARVPGEAAGTYQIFQNTLGIEDNGAFLAGNYTLVFVNGTLTITAAPGGGDNPDDGGDDTPTTPTTPTTPGTTTDGGTPTVIEDAPEQPEPEQIDDDENPLAGPSESIDDDGTPLARPTHQDCWVHWLMILGIIVTAVYDVVVLARRRKHTGTLTSYEDEVLGRDNRNA